jgi:hypothetical protein
VRVRSLRVEILVAVLDLFGSLQEYVVGDNKVMGMIDVLLYRFETVAYSRHQL